MSEWWTYSLSDFLLFAPRTYYRLIELYNADVWPLHVVMATTGVAIVTVLGRGTPGSRFAAVALGVCWGWVAWAFHLERYAQINWAAPWFAAAFALQGVLLAAWGLFASELPNQARNSRALALLALSVVVAYPVLAPLAGRSWTSSESFGIVPDPTALATLALVLRARGAMRWVLALVPLAWCATAAATLLAMESAQAYVVIAVALAALAFSVAKRPAGPGPR